MQTPKGYMFKKKTYSKSRQIIDFDIQDFDLDSFLNLQNLIFQYFQTSPKNQISIQGD